MKKPLLLSALLLALPVQGSAHPFAALYGDQISFDVIRKGKLVGQYTTRFSDTETGWRTDIEMNLKIPILLLWDYRYQYKASEIWQGDTLESVQVQVDDNGELTRFDFNRQSNQLVSADGRQLVDLPVLPTHHFNAAVLKADRVLNTLTGRDHPITLEKVGTQPLTINGRDYPARHYRYTQVLKGTETWYDEAGRWVQLRFPDKRGTPVTLRCRSCGVNASTAQLTDN